MDAEVGHMICFLEWFCHNSKLDLGHVCIGFESFSLGAEKNKAGTGFYSTTCGGIRIFWILLEAGWGLKRKENTNLYITLIFESARPMPHKREGGFSHMLDDNTKAWSRPPPACHRPPPESKISTCVFLCAVNATDMLLLHWTPTFWNEVILLYTAKLNWEYFPWNTLFFQWSGCNCAMKSLVFQMF